MINQLKTELSFIQWSIIYFERGLKALGESKLHQIGDDFSVISILAKSKDNRFS